MVLYLLVFIIIKLFYYNDNYKMIIDKHITFLLKKYKLYIKRHIDNSYIDNLL